MRHGFALGLGKKEERAVSTDHRRRVQATVPPSGEPGPGKTGSCRGVRHRYVLAGEPCDGQQRPYYRPGNSVTRAQLSKMLSRALDTAQE